MFALRIQLNSVFILNYLKLLLQMLSVYFIYCAYLFQSQEELQEYCRHREITYVALVSDKEGSHVKVKKSFTVPQISKTLYELWSTQLPTEAVALGVSGNSSLHSLCIAGLVTRETI